MKSDVIKAIPEAKSIKKRDSNPLPGSRLGADMHVDVRICLASSPDLVFPTAFHWQKLPLGTEGQTF